MDNSPLELKVVVLECFYDCWERPEARDYFMKEIVLKLEGYGIEYPYGVLPVDTYDFIATHFLVCRREGQEFKPLMAYKTTPFARCRAHNVTFPALTAIGAGASPRLRLAIERVMDDCLRRNAPLYYNSSWTVDPHIRKTDRTLSGRLKRILMAMPVHYHGAEPNAEFMTCGMVRFQTEKVFERMGYQLLCDEGGDVSQFQHASLSGDPVVMVHARGFTPEMVTAAAEIRKLWEDHLTVGSASPARERKAA